tara:strand:- start:357 stop:614 length:258 start_codon:yes stop_codon:yes gene_type:complete
MSIEIKNDSQLKQIIVEFVGNKVNPENDEVTIEHIAEVFSEEFPEFLLTLAEENWVNGYTQALTDVDFVKEQMKKKNESEEDNKE